MERAIILIAGWVMDLLIGDPMCLPHPVVYFGKWIAKGEKILNKGNYKMLKGACFAISSIALVFVLTFVALHYIYSINIIAAIVVQAILVFYCLAGKTLRSEVRMVFEALDKSLDNGRKQVARIVGRDTQQLSAQEIKTAALETLAENLSDGVIAPLFWFCILGVPGIMAYKMVNTLDSMIGYNNERYGKFGCWAAHIDDAANFIPARITALFITIIGWALFGHKHHSLLQHFCFVLRFGNKHASPNSGWPEAALAAVLDCKFGGPHNYFGKLFVKPFIGCSNREIKNIDMQISIFTCLMAEVACVIVSTIIFIVTKWQIA